MGSLRVIGAGLPRTGTTSLKAGLEQLLGGDCYHMFELMNRVETDGMRWYQALEGDLGVLDALTDGWAAAVDWPAALFWRELAERNPDALVVLSHRGSAETWWDSVDATVWAAMRRPDIEPMFAAFNEQMRAKAGLGDDWDDPEVAKAYYRASYDAVVAEVAPDRLVIWQPSDGWGPLCAALGVPEPDGDFFHNNDRREFRSKAGFE